MTGHFPGEDDARMETGGLSDFTDDQELLALTAEIDPGDDVPPGTVRHGLTFYDKSSKVVLRVINDTVIPDDATFLSPFVYLGEYMNPEPIYTDTAIPVVEGQEYVVTARFWPDGAASLQPRRTVVSLKDWTPLDEPEEIPFPEMPRQYTTQHTADHELMLVFRDDAHATAFADWLAEEGFAAFRSWAGK